MIEVEIDGRKVEVPEGSMLMEAANRLDIYVPHFCYHKKLSIAANCRMCLVEVEKAPKPMPACATPATAGMIVRTQSERAKQAQKSVMEFLLINHPLDCPICDQGGECQLQDLAVGYGGSDSRYGEPKRVVFHKPMGPLISAEEMTRCIHCTRCVRFGQEIAGVMELGMAGRGEHAEIMTFVGRSVDSELSGNMIDLCPVGALTSKPFRYEARAWELSRRKSISPHDSVGANLIVQVKDQRVMRVLPFENADVNECWISDRDRFSYEGLHAQDRLHKPLLKQGGEWREVEWGDALEYVRHALVHVKEEHGADQIGALAWPGSTVEELYLLAKLMRRLGSENVDSRLRQSDFSSQGDEGAAWLGMKVADIASLDRALLIGSLLRKEQPLLSTRLRAAAKRGARIAVINAVDDDLLMPLAARAIVRPSAWAGVLAEVANVIAQELKLSLPTPGLEASATAREIAALLLSGERKALFMGDLAQHHPQYAQLRAWAQWIADAIGGSFGILGDSGNGVGAYLARALPRDRGLDAKRMLTEPRKAMLLWNVEPEYDTANPSATVRALAQAETVIAFSPFRNGALEYADVILPITPFTETSGTFVNIEGRAQSFNGAVRPFGESRPGWKVLRVLGNLLQLDGFDYETSEVIRTDALPADIGARLSNRTATVARHVAAKVTGLERMGEVPIHFSDAIVRRSPPLQATRDARAPRAIVNGKTASALGLVAGEKVRVRQGEGSALLELAIDDRMAEGTVRVAAAHASTAALGEMFGPISVERA